MAPTADVPVSVGTAADAPADDSTIAGGTAAEALAAERSAADGTAFDVSGADRTAADSTAGVRTGAGGDDTVTEAPPTDSTAALGSRAREGQVVTNDASEGTSDVGSDAEAAADSSALFPSGCRSVLESGA